MICYIPGFICCGSENFGLGSLHDEYVGIAGANHSSIYFYASNAKEKEYTDVPLL
jgi:hypothetical protein